MIIDHNFNDNFKSHLIFIETQNQLITLICSNSAGSIANTKLLSLFASDKIVKTLQQHCQNPPIVVL
jgi:hypothetical protein